jgi:hypothetical protein
MTQEQQNIVMGWIANAEAFLATCRPSKEDNARMAQMVGECVAHEWLEDAEEPAPVNY